MSGTKAKKNSKQPREGRFMNPAVTGGASRKDRGGEYLLLGNLHNTLCKGFGLRVPFACPEVSSGSSQTGLEPPSRRKREGVDLQLEVFFFSGSREAVSREKSLKSANEKGDLRGH